MYDANAGLMTFRPVDETRARSSDELAAIAFRLIHVATNILFSMHLLLLIEASLLTMERSHNLLVLCF